MILGRHHHEQRRGRHVLDVGPGLVLPEHLHAPQRHLVAPRGRPRRARLGEPGVGVRGRQGRGRHGVLVHHRDHRRRLPRVAVGAILVEHRADRGDEVGPHDAPGVAMAADEGHLARHALHPPVHGPDHQHVPARVAGAPDPDAVGIDLGQRAGVADRVAVVAHLLPGVDLQPGLAVARAEVAVVEDDRPQAGGGEHLREPVEVHLLDGGEAVGHHDRRDRPRRSVGDVVPAPQSHALGIELDVASHVVSFPRVGSVLPDDPMVDGVTRARPFRRNPPSRPRRPPGRRRCRRRWAAGAPGSARAGRRAPAGPPCAEQPPVLEHAPGEDDQVGARVLRRPLAGRGHRGREAVVERAPPPRPPRPPAPARRTAARIASRGVRGRPCG